MELKEIIFISIMEMSNRVLKFIFYSIILSIFLQSCLSNISEKEKLTIIYNQINNSKNEALEISKKIQFYYQLYKKYPSNNQEKSNKFVNTLLLDEKGEFFRRLYSMKTDNIPNSRHIGSIFYHTNKDASKYLLLFYVYNPELDCKLYRKCNKKVNNIYIYILQDQEWHRVTGYQESFIKGPIIIKNNNITLADYIKKLL